MKVGDYVRTIYGIEKIQRIISNDYDKKNNYIVLEDFVFNGFELQSIFTADEVKSSPNIIDLIEVGDYVNGHRVNYINKDREHFNISFGDEDFNLKSKFNSDIYWLSKEDIKSVVTKEQFEEMEYKIC